jgi:ubiquinone/menaquinone biosynthesis C-methylase UbiE
MMEPTTDAYGRVAKFYDALLEPLNAPLRAIGWKLHPTDETMTVLDVGCGTGAHLKIYVDSGAECVGLDASPAMLEQASARLGDRADLELGDAIALPHSDSAFDLVFASLFLHELEPDVRAAALSEMARVTKPEGHILIIDYNVGALEMKGYLARAVSTVAERIAGGDHYGNWRAFLRSGGIPAMAPRDNLRTRRAKVVSGGNMGLWLLRNS